MPFCQVLIAHWNQYNKTYSVAYGESVNRRIVLAEKLRKLPLSFFGQRDLSDLTSTIMGDCTALERVFSNAIPQLFGTMFMFVITAIGLIVLGWRMGLCIAVPVPAAALIVLTARKAQTKAETANYEAKRAAYDGVQEYLDTIQGLKSCSREQEYLSGLEKKLDHVVRYSFCNELAPGAATTAAQFVLRLGLVTALAGPSGSGKSTVSRLAARFWDADAGQITLGGVDVKTVEPETLFKNFSIVFQDVMLFDDTVMENIRLGRSSATDEEVRTAARAAQCEEFIERLPQGYQTNIGENGSALSGGERQRISTARALLKDAPVILLDEATASMDAESETLVQDALSALLRNKTVMVIAHRMRTVASADKIVVLDGGCVSETGTPDELMAKGGLYACLVSLQQGSQI